MPKIEVCAPPKDSSCGASIHVDGNEVPKVRDIRMHIGMDSVPTAEIEVLATDSMSFHGEAALHVTIIALPGFVVIEEPQPDGSKRYRCDRVLTERDMRDRSK